MTALTGWLLDVYDDPQDGIVVWLLGDDGLRYRLHQDFPVSFYAAGPSQDLRSLWHFLEGQAPSTVPSTGSGLRLRACPATGLNTNPSSLSGAAGLAAQSKGAPTAIKTGPSTTLRSAQGPDTALNSSQGPAAELNTSPSSLSGAAGLAAQSKGAPTAIKTGPSTALRSAQGPDTALNSAQGPATELNTNLSSLSGAAGLAAQSKGAPTAIRTGPSTTLHSAQGPASVLKTSPSSVLCSAQGPANGLNSAQGTAGYTIRLSREERRDLFSVEPVTVLACQVSQPAALPGLFRLAAQRFPDLTYYDADIPSALRYAAVYKVFPLARCRVEYATDQRGVQNGTIKSLEALDTPWELDTAPAPLRTLTLEPDVAPSHGEPQHIAIRIGLSGAPGSPGKSPGPVSYRLPLSPARPFLINLRAILRRHDPDLLLSTYGDTWLFPRLIQMSRECAIPLPLNRDAGRGVAHRKEHTYFSYGQVIHRGQQFHLFGRWHIDTCNAMLFHDYGMDGVKELGRVSALPMQTVARVSPGTGISAMQILTALRLGVLVPWHKQQAEKPKTALDLLRADQGGMVYQPTIGLHPHVAEVDFISMYPSIMAHFNISPETVNVISQNLAHAGEKPLNELNFGIGSEEHCSVERGLVPQTLEPLLNKRLKLKEQLATLPGWDPRRKAYSAQASAHKWLLVTCFGYLGYKNARFGRIESHEAVTAYGRETLLTAKEAAEDLGGTVLHMYVDGLWVRREGFTTPADFQPMVEEIAARAGLPIALDGVYRWVAFLPSRVNASVPVANRYFGVFQDGSLKMRGIEARREDTPPFIAHLQVEMLERLARVPDPGPETTPEEMRLALAGALPGLVAFLRRRLRDLRLGRIPLQELLVTQRLSRALDEYKTPSPAARAAAQLAAVDRPLRAGQRVRFFITLGEPGVHAWDLPQPVNPAALDVRRYTELTLRAAGTVVQPLGISEQALRDWVLESMVRLPLPGKYLRAPQAPFAFMDSHAASSP